MRGGGASSSRGASSPRSAARAREAAEERLREALADGLARVSFRLINSSLSELTRFHFCYFTAGPAGLCPENAWWRNFFLTRGQFPWERR